MVKRAKSTFVCTNCGESFPTWSGRCSNCGEWNTLVEQAPLVDSPKASNGKQLQATSLRDIRKAKPSKHLSSGLSEVDLVLGGGIVPGSVVLLGGQPGIGKSTLLTQLADGVAAENSVLYVSGEESTEQIGLRAARLGAKAEALQLVSANNTDDIVATILSGKYALVIVDSIQTLSCEAVSSAAGSVSQITNSTHLLTAAAKRTNTALLIIGHVTKEGSIAGPKLLEHMVDVVLQLEGDRYGGFKLLRAIKNRFGSTNEAGIFEMAEEGLKTVANPSAALLAERQVSDGSIVLATMEGNRPVLVEIQALVNKSSYGYPKRTASGFDLNRLNLLIAVLERRTKLNLAEKDIFVNVVGGIKVNDPAADLAVCMAIASADKGMALKTDAVVFGEIGLSGEVRHVPSIDKRLSEARKLGFKLAIGPRYSKADAILSPVSDVRSALNNYLSK